MNRGKTGVGVVAQSAVGPKRTSPLTSLPLNSDAISPVGLMGVVLGLGGGACSSGLVGRGRRRIAADRLAGERSGKHD